MSRLQWQLESYLKNLFQAPPIFSSKNKYAATALVFSANLEQLLITKRSKNLSAHPGEYALPGGLAESGESAVQTALRELYEETGIDTNQVAQAEPFLQTRTPYGMQIITFIMRLKPGNVTLTLDPAEVDSAYWLNSDFFLQAQNCRKEQWTHKNISRTVYFWTYEDHEIWGVTGEIITGLYNQVTGKDIDKQIAFSENRQELFWKNKRLI